MLLSKYFMPVMRNNPAEAKIISHILMLRSGMIRQHTSGIYNWLPLGTKVLRNIGNVIRKNMDAAGCTEILMPCVQDSELWIKSGRYENYGKEMLRFKDRNDHELFFGPTNEEIATDIISNNIQSPKDLPQILYQIQEKFRDEIRPRYGVMRGREFIMKDAYSFDVTVEGALKAYDTMFMTYLKIFNELDLHTIPLVAESGEIGGNLSHEFHVVTDNGETTLYYDSKFDELDEVARSDIHLMKSLYAATNEMHIEHNCPLEKEQLKVSKGIEIGQIFNFADKYSKPLNAMVQDSKNKLIPVQMGAYGIGISRVVAAIIETHHDDKGIIWPMNIAPFKVAIVNLDVHNSKCNELSEKIYKSLLAESVDVLYDDKDSSPGSKFMTNDLIGTPLQIIIGKKNSVNNVVELKHRKTGEISLMNSDEVVQHVVNIIGS